MEHERIFALAGLAATSGWIALAAAPLRRGVLISLARGVGVLLAATYAVLIVANWGRGEGGFGSLAEVRRLFDLDALLLAGWIHYLAFDLWVGAWEAEDAPRRGLPHWLLLPCLFLTFMFGPMGLLAYLILRTAAGRLRKARAATSA